MVSNLVQNVATNCLKVSCISEYIIYNCSRVIINPRGLKNMGPGHGEEDNVISCNGENHLYHCDSDTNYFLHYMISHYLLPHALVPCSSTQCEFYNLRG